MQLIIKVLKGEDFTLNVTATTKISEIKQEIEKHLNVPKINQKLLLLGRTLSDEATVESYPNIKDGTKLNLIIMRQTTNTNLPLKEIVQRSFRKYYNEQQTENLTKEFMLDFENKLKQLSLDDIERLSDHLLCIY